MADQYHTFMKSFICLRSIRPWSSRCSAAVSLKRSLASILVCDGSARVTHWSMPLMLGPRVVVRWRKREYRSSKTRRVSDLECVMQDDVGVCSCCSCQNKSCFRDSTSETLSRLRMLPGSSVPSPLYQSLHSLHGLHRYEAGFLPVRALLQ